MADEIRRHSLTILLVSHFCPFPPTHGNRRRVIALIRWLRAEGHRVIFVLQPVAVDHDMWMTSFAAEVDLLVVVRSWRSQVWGWARARLCEAGVVRNAHPDALCWPATRRAVQRLVGAESIDVMLVVYGFLSQCLEEARPGTLRIVDTLEVFQRQVEASAGPRLSAALHFTEDAERRLLTRADVVVAIQPNDARVLTALLPSKRIVHCGYPVVTRSWAARRLRRDSVLVVGSGNPFNRQGLDLFLREAWPSVRARWPRATLRVVGDVGSAAPIASAGVEVVGRISDEQLAAEYAQAHVVINPQMSGTGLKIKGVEALGLGCPCVFTPAGADGLEAGAGWAFLVARDWDEFVAHVLALLRNDSHREEVERGALAFAAQRFAPTAVFRELGDVLAEHARPGQGRPPA